MLPQVGATELLLLAFFALIVVGPKDLPVLMRKIGQWVGKMRGLAAEFRSSFDELARQSELDELRKEVEALRNTSRIPDPLSDVHQTFNDVKTGLDADGFAVSASPFSENPFEHAVGLEDPHGGYPAAGPGFGAEPEPEARPTRVRKARAAADPEAPAKPRRVRKAEAAADPIVQEASPVRRRAKKAAAVESEG